MRATTLEFRKLDRTIMGIMAVFVLIWVMPWLCHRLWQGPVFQDIVVSAALTGAMGGFSLMRFVRPKEWKVMMLFAGIGMLVSDVLIMLALTLAAGNMTEVILLDHDNPQKRQLVRFESADVNPWLWDIKTGRIVVFVKTVNVEVLEMRESAQPPPAPEGSP